MMPYMIKHNWLVTYQSQEGIERILSQMDNRIKKESNMRFSVGELKSFYSEFEEEFTLFFEELRTHSTQKLLSL
jgi:acyl carrier protein phosphodiesterase